MKRLVILICLLTLSFGAFSQTKVKESEVPKSVLLGLENIYFSYKVKGWYKAPGQFIADLVVDGQQGRAFFTSDGSWQYSSFPVADQELPTLANTYFQNNYPGYKIKRTDYVEEMSGDNYYRMMIAQKAIGATEYELIFNIRGSLIKSNAPDPEVVKKEYLIRQNPEDAGKQQPEQESKSSSKGSKKDKKELDINTPDAVLADQPTEEVLAAFQKRYPQTRINKGPDWGMRDENYVGRFENRSKAKLEVLYAPNGSLISTGSTLLKDRYPRAILKYLEEKYRKEKYTIERIDRVDYDTKYRDPKTGQRPKSYFYVVISQKVKGEKQKRITRMTFDNTYKFTGLLAEPQDKFDKY